MKMNGLRYRLALGVDHQFPIDVFTCPLTVSGLIFNSDPINLSVIPLTMYDSTLFSRGVSSWSIADDESAFRLS